MSTNPKHTALVTGASSGIGREMAKILASKGSGLVLVGRSGDKLHTLKEELESAFGIAVGVIIADLSKQGAAEHVYAQCICREIEVEMLVNNAGVGHFGEVTEMEALQIEQIVALNITTLTQLAVLFGADMKRRGHGRILNVSSVAGFAPMPWMTVYSATKNYVRNFSLALREELRSSGVTVTCLAPGTTDTNFFIAAGASGVRGSLMSARRVADAGINGMFHGKAMVIPGFLNRIRVASIKFTTPAMLGRIIRSLHN